MTIEKVINDALQLAWDEWCIDTRSCPDFIELRGKEVWADFSKAGNFTTFVKDELMSSPEIFEEMREKFMEIGWCSTDGVIYREVPPSVHFQPIWIDRPQESQGEEK